MIRSIFTKANIPYWLPFLLVVPALLINLGSMPLLADEPTRALVALEMLISKNYIVPTINGDYYYNKPPLYNWLVLGLYQLTGHVNEWVIRIPTVISILFFSIIAYFFTQKYTSKKIAFIIVLAYLTSGRVLFYDSFLGLIDTLFSALIFLNFMLVYYFDQKKNYYYLFIFTYLITAIAYMLKGLPALVFQAVTLFTFFTFLKKEFKMLFSRYHLVGIFLLVFSVALYYLQYLRYNTLEAVFKTIVSESAKRTVVENNILDSVKHILSFPFSTLLHFLPWTVPFLLIFRKNNFQRIRRNSFLNYCFVILLTNIVVYWLSPETVPRYLFMFLPLIFIISYVLYYDAHNDKFRGIFEKILLLISILIVFIFMTIPFISVIPAIPFFYPKLVFLVMVLSILTFYYYKNSADKILIFCSILLLSRVGFDWYVFPSRLQTEPQVAYRKYGIEIGKITKGSPLFIYNDGPLDHDISFYITRERMALLENDFTKPVPNTYYITSVLSDEMDKNKITIFYEFFTSFNKTKLYLVKLK